MALSKAEWLCDRALMLLEQSDPGTRQFAEVAFACPLWVARLWEMGYAKPRKASVERLQGLCVFFEAKARRAKIDPAPQGSVGFSGNTGCTGKEGE